MATTAAAYRTHPTLVDKVDRVVKETFGHDFIERRFREHRAYQEQLASQGAAEIVHEVVSALETFAELRAGKGPGKIARLR